MIDEIVNNYRVTELIGEGGMGAVYLAEHPFMGRKAAIKVLRRELAEDSGLVERFMNEARAANAIRHPNIIDIIDVGRMPSGIPYLMMEFLEGESLAHRIMRGVLAVPEAIDVILQSTAALAAAHGKGIVHRDLKPDNLYLVPDDSAPGGVRVKVLDFGIAKLRGELSSNSAKTQAGAVMGTPPYMSPEQCRGVTDEIDDRTDVYALGIILYEMLCGSPPFVSAGWGETILAHMVTPPPPPRSRNPSIPESLEAVILKALEKAPAARFQSAAEMRAAVRSLSAVGTFPPRYTSATRTAAAPPARHATPPVRPVTTFEDSAGEMTNTDPTLAESPGARRDARRRSVLIAGGGAAVAAVVVVVAIAASGGRQHGNAVQAAPPAAAIVPATAGAPAPRVAPPPPPPSPPPPSEPPPPTSTQVRRGSDPDGTAVTDIGHAGERIARGERPKTRASNHGAPPVPARKLATAAAAQTPAPAATQPPPAAPAATPPPAAPAVKPKRTEKW